MTQTFVASTGLQPFLAQPPSVDQK